MRDRYNFEKMQKPNNLTQKIVLSFDYIKTTQYYVLLTKSTHKISTPKY